MIRVLHIVTEMDGGGVERLVFNFLQNIDREKVHFDFVVHGNNRGMLEEEAEKLGSVIYHVVPKTEKYGLFRKQMREIYEKGNYDAVHDHRGYNAFIPLFMAKKYGIKCRIAHAHIAYEPENPILWLKRKISSALTKLAATRLMACSVDAGEYQWGNVDHLVLPDGIAMGSYAFSNEKRAKIRSELGLDGKFTVGCVSRLVPQKNYPRLLEIFREVQKIVPDAALLIVGRGEQESMLRERVAERDLRNVLFLGVRDDVGDILSAMDVFVLPTLFEGFGMVLIEAQANGVETLCSLENVPKETMISDRISYISIYEPNAVWRDRILAAADRNVKRGDPRFNERASIYEIKMLTEKLIAEYGG